MVHPYVQPENVSNCVLWRLCFVNKWTPQSLRTFARICGWLFILFLAQLAPIKQVNIPVVIAKSVSSI